MKNMNLQFSFQGKARWIQMRNLLMKGKVYTFITENDILAIIKAYNAQKRKEVNSKKK